MKSFHDTVRQRYSCRAYADRQPDAAALEAVLQDARLAPSATNRQPWRFIVIPSTDAEGRSAVIRSYAREWVATAPTYIIVCGLPDSAWVRPYDGKNHIDVDLAIAAEHICLSATANGLDTCWICNFDPVVLSEGLGLPAELVPMCIIPIGYRAEGSPVPEKKRLPLTDIVIRR